MSPTTTAPTADKARAGTTPYTTTTSATSSEAFACAHPSNALAHLASPSSMRWPTQPRLQRCTVALPPWTMQLDVERVAKQRCRVVAGPSQGAMRTAYAVTACVSCSDSDDTTSSGDLSTSSPAFSAGFQLRFVASSPEPAPPSPIDECADNSVAQRATQWATLLSLHVDPLPTAPHDGARVSSSSAAAAATALEAAVAAASDDVSFQQLWCLLYAFYTLWPGEEGLLIPLPLVASREAACAFEVGLLEEFHFHTPVVHADVDARAASPATTGGNGATPGGAIALSARSSFWQMPSFGRPHARAPPLPFKWVFPLAPQLPRLGLPSYVLEAGVYHPRRPPMPRPYRGGGRGLPATMSKGSSSSSSSAAAAARARGAGNRPNAVGGRDDGDDDGSAPESAADSVLYARCIPDLHSDEGEEEAGAGSGSAVSFRLASADDEGFLELFTRWHDSERVWQGWKQRQPREEQRRYLRGVAESGWNWPVLGLWGDEPWGYVEVYWAKESNIATFYDVRDYDRGFHALVGEERFRGPHRVRSWMGSLVHMMFLLDPRTERVVLEPRASNTKMINYACMVGGHVEKLIDLPHKRAALVIIPRERFFQLCPMGPLPEHAVSSRATATAA